MSPRQASNSQKETGLVGCRIEDDNNREWLEVRPPCRPDRAHNFRGHEAARFLNWLREPVKKKEYLGGSPDQDIFHAFFLKKNNKLCLKCILD